MKPRFFILMAAVMFVSVAHSSADAAPWPRNQYTGPGGGLSTAPGGGLYSGPGGGLSTGPGGGLYTGPGGGLSTAPGGGMSSGPKPYLSNIPPWPVFIKELEDRGMQRQADLIKAHLKK